MIGYKDNEIHEIAMLIKEKMDYTVKLSYNSNIT